MIRYLKIFLKKLGFEPYVVRIYAESFSNRFGNLFYYKKRSMFSDVTIETSSYCNRKCPSCPVSIAPRLEKIYMSDVVFEKVLKELADIKYKGRVSLNFYNEPLEDKNVVSKVRNIRRYVPKAKISINSNGDYLNNELLSQLTEAGLNILYVTAYSENAYNRLMNISHNAEPEENAVLEIRMAPEFIGNRAGSLYNGNNSETIIADCHLPSKQLVINYKSQVVICCNDYFENIVLGNIEDNSLLDIWYGKKFMKTRNTLKNKNRNAISTCANCNYYCSPYESKYLTADEIKSYNAGELKLR